MGSRNDQKRTGAVLLAVGGVILFSAKAVFVKLAYRYEVDTVTLLLIRMMIALPVYLAIVLVSMRKWRKKYSFKPFYLPVIVLLGMGGYYFASYLDFTGLKYVSASLERLLLFVYPTIVVILTAIVNRRAVPEKQAIAILITYFGIFLVFFQNIFIGDRTNVIIGGMLIMSCALVYACYMVGFEKLMAKTGAMPLTCYTLIIASLAVLGHYSVSDQSALGTIRPEVLWIGGAMAVVSTILPAFMIAEAINRLGASHVAIIGSIGPISTILLAAIFLGERITAFQGLGAIVVISGVMLVNTDSQKILSKRKKEKELRKAA